MKKFIFVIFGLIFVNLLGFSYGFDTKEEVEMFIKQLVVQEAKLDADKVETEYIEDNYAPRWGNGAVQIIVRVTVKDKMKYFLIQYDDRQIRVTYDRVKEDSVLQIYASSNPYKGLNLLYRYTVVGNRVIEVAEVCWK